jgi:hypothetical protein
MLCTVNRVDIVIICICSSLNKDKQKETDSIFESITSSTPSQIIEPIPWDQYREISVFYPYPPSNRGNIVDNFTMRMEEVKEIVSQMSLKFENPFIEPKLAHDFSLWGEFMDEYLLAQVKDSGITDRYRNEQIMRETINSLRENDSAFDEIIKNRINIYGKFYSGDVNAINNFLHTKNPEDGKYIIDLIMQKLRR